MKLDDALERAFNDQITLEFEASMVYRQLAVEMETRALPGMAAWLRHQADEEIVHANKFIDHMADRGNRAQIGMIPGPQVEVTDVLSCFRGALTHEQKVSAAIRALYQKAEQSADLDSRPLLNWFLSEQIEEEATIDEIIGRVELIANDGPGLLRLDEELSHRPVATTESTTVQ